MPRHRNMASRLVLRITATIIPLWFVTTNVHAQCAGEWASAPAIAGPNHTVEAMIMMGGDLYVGGHFNMAGGVAANNIAKWDGTTWSALGTGISGPNAHVFALAEFNGDLYAGGRFTGAGVTSASNIARWNGTSWSALNTGTNGDVYALSAYQSDSESLYVGGGFSNAGGTGANGLARWNGSVWTSVDGGVSGIVDALAVYDDGSNSYLYVGGNFISVGGGTSATYIARWNEGWSAVGSGMNGRVRALKVYDDGGPNPPMIYVAGLFSTAGGVSASNIARWNGSTWSALAGGNVNDTIYALEVFDDGPGPALFAGGDFTAISALSASRIAKWRDGSWSAMGSGVDAHPYSLRAFDNGPGPALFVGGPFSTAGGSPVSSLAKWQQSCQRVYVKSSASGANDGTSWPNAYRNLQDALAAASSGTEIWVAAGTYKPDRGIAQTLGDRAATFQLESGVEFFGGFAGGETARIERDASANTTILSGDLSANDAPVPCTQDSPDCNSFGGLCVNGACIIQNNNSENSHHVVTGSGTDATAILDGFSITAGNANVVEAQTGAGMYNVAGSPTVTDCTFSGNSSIAGSGIFNGSASAPIVTNCTFRANSSGAGGGMHNNGSSPALINCTFSRNSSNNVGGGMQNFNGSSPTVTSCTFSGNSAINDGGGMVNSSGSPKVINCLFTGNAANNGGGMSNVGNTIPIITNCTFSRNSANLNGGGIYNTSTGNPAANNCIVWGNEDAGGMDESAQIHTDSGTPTVSYSIVQGGWSGAGGNNSSSNPLFFDPDGADNAIGTIDDDLRLRYNSEAIDEGNSAAVPADTLDLDGDLNVAEPIPFDLGGNARNVGGTVDMGAYEYFADCNNNGVDDATDIANQTSEDCDASAGWPANGIPDECDIASCPDGNISCDDCNLNGVPDRCDIVSLTSQDANSDLIPDECASSANLCTEPGQELNWTCVDNWPALAGSYPDNQPDPNAQPNVAVTLSPSTTIVLDETVVIPLLRIEEGAELRITQTGAQGDLSFSAPATFEVHGTVLVSGARIVGGGVNPEVTIGPEGMYEADGAAVASAGTVSASLIASNMSVVGSDCFIPPCPHGGEVTLTDSMSVTTTGGLTIDGSLANGECHLHREGRAAALSFHTPPSIRVVGPGSSISVGAVFSMQGAASFLHESLVPITIGGDWDNQSVRPDCFEAHDGTIRMNGGAPQSFEVAATDIGAVGELVEAPFEIGTLEIAANTAITLQDSFDNDLQGQASCGEAQYVGTLVVEAGATITVQNCRLYYDTLAKDSSAQIIIQGCGEVRSSDDPLAPAVDPTGLNKSRAISFTPPSGAIAGGAAESALRVTLASLHRVSPPYTGGATVPFTLFEGQVLWVGPPAQYVESTSSGTPFLASALQCSPHYRDWSTVGLLHVFGSAIVPSSSYRVQTVAASCAGLEAQCTAISPGLTVNTTRWGDVETPYNPPSATTQPDVGDISALVNKFRSATGAPIKARALIAGNDAFGTITTVGVDLGFGHIAACVDAFRGTPYPFKMGRCAVFTPPGGACNSDSDCTGSSSPPCNLYCP